MNYNCVLVKYKNSWQIRRYQFVVKSDIDNELDAFDVFPSSDSVKKSKDFEKTENEIDNAFALTDSKYHFEGRSAYVSVNRSKNKIYYYSRSNDWNNGYFVTFTIDPKKYNSFDYEVVSKLIRNFTKLLRRYDQSIYALFVPEKHKSGAFHFHGIVSEGLKKYLVYSGHMIKGNMIYNCTLWKHGFSNVTKVQNALAVEKYICKYTSKELLNDTKFQHRYFTLNLQEAEMIKLNIVDSDEMIKEIASSGHCLFMNTDGSYNRTTYAEVENSDKILQILDKYVIMTKAITDMM